MRFALLGNHPDGLDMARALAATGRHALVVYGGPAQGLEILARDGLKPPRVGDLEEALADPAVEAVIVAGSPSQRAAQLRRALQSEHHVLCVHPVDPSPDVAYEAALLQSDVRRVLLPLLPEFLHPGIQRLAERAGRGLSEAPSLVEFERSATEACLLDAEDKGYRPGLPGWDSLRAVGGEIAEVFAQTGGGEVAPREPLLLTGRFVHGGLWRATLMPFQARASWRIVLAGKPGRTELAFPDGWPGPARLTYVDESGEARVEEWPPLNPWGALVEQFEAAVADLQVRRQVVLPGVAETMCLTERPGRLGWLDAIRALELDDAMRRSAHRGRASSLDFQEATEEASFKGAMTLVGCGLLWMSLLLLILSMWLPILGWFIFPAVGLFLAMQLLRWAVPTQEAGDKPALAPGLPGVTVDAPIAPGSPGPATDGKETAIRGQKSPQDHSESGIKEV